jgi:hypothetical protein
MESALRFLADFGATEARFSRGLRRLWAKTRAPGPHRGCKRLLGGPSGPENGGSARGCAIDRGGCAIDRFWGESENRLAVALSHDGSQPVRHGSSTGAGGLTTMSPVASMAAYAVGCASTTTTNSSSNLIAINSAAARGFLAPAAAALPASDPSAARDDRRAGTM